VEEKWADGLTWDEWFRLANAPSTYRYDCYVNPFCGFDCTVFTGHATSIEFPLRRLWSFGESD
jgi:hypothetical protein